jgi:hypothetical protein
LQLASGNDGALKGGRSLERSVEIAGQVLAEYSVKNASIRRIMTSVRFRKNECLGDSQSAVVARCAEILSKLMVQNLAGAIME